MNFLYEHNKHFFVCCTGLIGFFIMVFISPIETVYFLILSSLYCLYVKNYKDIFIIWVFFFLSWYCVFTLLLIDYDNKILIGGKYTSYIIYHLSPIYIKYSFLERFCVATIVILDIVSVECGFPLYIPSIWKGLMLIFKFILGGGKGGKGPAGCSPEDKHNKSSSSNTSPCPSPGISPSGINFNRFFSSLFRNIPVQSSNPVEPSSPTDFYDKCKNLRTQLRRNRKWDDSFNYTTGKFKGKNVIAYEMRVPILNIILREGCHKGDKDPKC